MSALTTRLRGKSELGIAALLGILGAVVLWDGLHLQTTFSQTDPVGPRTMPIIVAGILLVCAVLLAVNVLRGGSGEAEEGEDVDLTHPSDWRTLLPLVGAFVLNIVLIDVVGWVISGALMFYISVWALGSRRYVRDALISLALSLATFYGFYLGLGIPLPAGPLEGVL
ncbi:membrane protein [Zafaria cholistanensis]|uniref:Membrane protein n=1 Tax=Zafaria cholistanensis TaxID=1682741 RepID=A0A5A7NLN2_9MICC|nr:tripartite tricarboxylate transporter TctB family protein [Zafaria cholistanensis]GER21864.1 membrane protein [Zafaria cholistanensis]